MFCEYNILQAIPVHSIVQSFINCTWRIAIEFFQTKMPRENNNKMHALYRQILTFMMDHRRSGMISLWTAVKCKSSNYIIRRMREREITNKALAIKHLKIICNFPSANTLLFQENRIVSIIIFKPFVGIFSTVPFQNRPVHNRPLTTDH